jgi:pyridoxamine 5'-phosphate oxidase
MSIGDLRRDYRGAPLLEAEAGDDPLALFDRWFADARVQEPDPTAMTLATATPDGHPSARVVLLKEVDRHGFVFYTNYDSRKARELARNPAAALLFYWRGAERQVRVEGRLSRTSPAESDDYFGTRPIESRISVYASRQSAVLASRDTLDQLYAEAAARFADGRVPRPSWWGGYRLVPDEIEFWQGRLHRLHDRLRYTRTDAGRWRRERLAP